MKTGRCWMLKFQQLKNLIKKQILLATLEKRPYYKIGKNQLTKGISWTDLQPTPEMDLATLEKGPCE